jgi:hypothetical protein
MSNLTYGAFLGIWISAAIVEIRERKGNSAAWPLRILMGVGALVAFVSYVTSNQ